MEPQDLLSAISAMLEKAEGGLAQCREGLLLVSEASKLLREIDGEVRAVLPPDSRLFRIYDREQTTIWWPGDVKYLPPTGCANIQRRVKLLETVLTEVQNDVPRPGHHGRRPAEPTGWQRVDRGIQKAIKHLSTASTEEDFQAIGLFCREVLISLAQEVYDPSRHPSLDGVIPSDTDAKRRLEAYVAAELGGDSNEAVRAHVRSALRLANDLQHRRTATYRDAALCVEASTAVVNSVSIVAGQHNP